MLSNVPIRIPSPICISLRRSHVVVTITEPGVTATVPHSSVEGDQDVCVKSSCNGAGGGGGGGGGDGIGGGMGGLVGSGGGRGDGEGETGNVGSLRII